eukprot:NODE_1019_length_1094_cov_175.200957_g708_i0.p1 GENE.NODE_1019_length_1094_cov_175.200957_g708_i0~~NODE_1019_length_1094_cov_175.200957_g708_i0.p1  ORF type:complete len:322 (+),score=86.89 NODE_1019_length_1094_cov_175.200957_g708_i0:59-1024(+)
MQQQEQDDNDHSTIRLRKLLGTKNFADVTHLELTVDTTEHSIAMLGDKLPNLASCKLSNSKIGSVRDLGTRLSGLRILWLNRCGLADLDGLSAMPLLAELFCAFNNIADLSPVAYLEQLEVLDLEANQIGDLDELSNLSTCPKLSTLTLDGNPVSQADDYQDHILEMLPALQYLDDMPVERESHETSPADAHRQRQRQASLAFLDEASGDAVELERRRGELEHLNEAIRSSEGSVSSTLCDFGLPLTAPATTASSLLFVCFAFINPFLSRENSPLPEHATSASELTYHASSVLCGNPSKSLRSRRESGCVEPDDDSDSGDT